MPNDIHPEGSPNRQPETTHHDGAESWIESLLDLINSRVALFQIEAKQAAMRSIMRLAMLIAAAIGTVMAWLLVIAAAVGIVNVYIGLAWYWTCLVIAGIHLLAILAMIRTVRAPSPPTFEHTRSEFKKDREWFQNLQHRKSKP